MLVLADAVDRLRATGEAGDDLGGDEGVERRPEPARSGQVDGSRLRQLADGHVVEQRIEHRADLGGCQGPVPEAEERQSQQRRRRDRRHPVDPVQHLEGDLLGDQLPLGADLPEGDRLGEVEVGLPELLALGADVLEHPGQALGLLLGAVLLGGHGRHLLELVVGDRHRDEEDVVDAPLPERLHQVAEDSEAGWAELARPGPAALQVPLEVVAPLDEVAEVGPQGELVDGVVLDGPADEDDAAAPQDGPHGPERHVDAAEDVVTGQPRPAEGAPQDERVEVGLVAGKEDEGVLAVQGPEAVEGVGVDLDVVGPEGEAGQPVDRPEGQLALHGHHLVERRPRLPLEFVPGLAELGRPAVRGSPGS